MSDIKEKQITHTPGPWAVSDILDNGRLGIVTFMGGNIVVGSNNNLKEADAKVIAVAPDLFALCIEIRNWLRPELVKEPHRSFFWKLTYLIKKATA